MSRWAGLQKDSQASAVAFLESLDQVQFDAFGSLGVFFMLLYCIAFDFLKLKIKGNSESELERLSH